MKKPIDWAIRAVRDESECIVGWAKQALYFCEHVIVMVDPHSQDYDETYELLKQFPQIMVFDQNRSLGDSDNTHKGPKGHLIMHGNMEMAINLFVDDGQWVMKTAPDERFDPARWEILAEEIRMVRRLGLGKGILQTTMHNFYPDESHCLDIYHDKPWGYYKCIPFFEKDGYWTKGKEAHSGFQYPKRNWWTMEPFYHYNWVKRTREPFGLWRDQQRYKTMPRYDLVNPIPNWRTLA